jgi:hypothetical protein
MSARANLRNLGYTSLVLFLLYVSVYTVLSLCGEYQPVWADVNGVKEYAWAPLGFYDDAHRWAGSGAAGRTHAAVMGGWNSQILCDLFYPIYSIDRLWIHPGKPGP